jgi:hypothetical protein
MLAILTLVVINRQTKATEDAAQAALLNAQAVINSERPWLLVLPQYLKDEPTMPAIWVINKGRTPARIIAYSEKQIQLGEKMPSVPVYGELQKGLGQKVLLPQESTEIHAIILERDVRAACGSNVDFQMVRDWKEEVYVFGVIHYQNLLNTVNTETYETKWCCRYFPIGDRMVKLKVHGPEGYNAHT